MEKETTFTWESEVAEHSWGKTTAKIFVVSNVQVQNAKALMCLI